MCSSDLSDVGLVDLGKADGSKKGAGDARESVERDEKKGPAKGAAWEMIKLFESSGKKLKEMLADRQNAEAAGGAPAGQK